MNFTPSFLCCGFQVVFARTSITNHLHGGLPDNKTMTAKTRAPINSSELSVVSCVVSRSHACIQNTNRIRALILFVFLHLQQTSVLAIFGVPSRMRAQTMSNNVADG